MNDSIAQQEVDQILSAIFGTQITLPTKALLGSTPQDVHIPEQAEHNTGDAPVWIPSKRGRQAETHINLQDVKDQSQRFSYEIKPAPSAITAEELISMWPKINTLSGSRGVESNDVFESDSIYSSKKVYKSFDIYGSQKIFLSERMTNSKNCVQSFNSDSSDHGFRLTESREVNNSAYISWSGRIADSWFIQDSYGLRDCLFCAHIAEKQFCIGNMQFNEDHYFEMKDKIRNYIVNELIESHRQ